MGLYSKIAMLYRLRQNQRSMVIVDDKDEATIPFETGDNVIYVPVEIGGRIYGFLLDSCGLNMLTPETATAIGAHVAGHRNSHLGAGSNAHKVGFTSIKRMVLGGVVVLDNQRVRVQPLPGLSSGRPVHGVIGIEAFRRFVVRIDYEAGSVSFIRPRSFRPDNNGASVPLSMLGSILPTCGASVDELDGQFMIDTGNLGALELFAPFAKAHDLYTKYACTEPVSVGVGLGGEIRARITRAGRFSIAGHALRRPVTNLITDTAGAFASKSLAGNIGGRVLKRFTVTFDFAHKRLHLAPNVSFQRPMGDSLFINRAAGSGAQVTCNGTAGV